jgi:hypothetical protein
MSDARIIHRASGAYDGVAASLVSRQVETARQVNQIATADGLRPEIIDTTRQFYPVDWWLPGAVVIGTHQDGPRRVPAPSVLSRIDATAVTAPSGTFEAYLLIQPANTEGFALSPVFVTIGPGKKLGGDTPHLALNAGDWVAISVTSAGGASDVGVVCTLIPV